MASSMNRIGNNPFFRREAGGFENTRNLTGNQLQDFMKQPLRDPLRDLLKQPFRPQMERRMPSPIPKIPFKEYNLLRQRALDLAWRIAKATIPAFRFRQLFQWLLDWLIDWFLKQIAKRAKMGGWTQTAICLNPQPPDGPKVFVGSSGPSGPIAQFYATNCLQFQLASGPPDLAGLPDTAMSAIEHNRYGGGWYQIVGTWDRTASLPAIYWEPDPIEDWPPALDRRPPRALERHLKPDWPAAIDNTVPDPEKDTPPESPEDEPLAGDERKDSTIVSIDNKLQTETRRVQRSRKPTRTREKEQKFGATSAATRAIFGFLARNKERLTELDDLLDIFIDSMPKDIQEKMPKRNGRGTPDLKMKYIYDNFDKIDWNKFADEWVKNWIEDKVVGTAIAGSDKGAKARGESSTIGSRNWLHSATKGKMPWFR